MGYDRVNSSGGCAGPAWAGRNLGRDSAAEFALALGRLYGLDRPTTEELLAGLWDWYVGELNTGMAAYFQRLRPRFRTAILSNAAEGGRREEERRYGFARMADVAAARWLGIRAVLFQSTAQAMADVEACLADSQAEPSPFVAVSGRWPATLAGQARH